MLRVPFTLAPSRKNEHDRRKDSVDVDHFPITVASLSQFCFALVFTFSFHLAGCFFGGVGFVRSSMV